jgi:RimJ/RimL family protein N-acetyltransferase
MTIETDRLLLREIEQDDLRVIIAYNSHPEVRRYALSGQWTEKVIRRFVANAIAGATRTPRTFYALAVCLKDDMRMIGVFTLVLAPPYLEMARMGWELAREHWGRGYATEAARAFTAFAFESAGVKELVCDCFPGNRASVRVMEKLGMWRERGGLLLGWALAFWYGQWRPMIRHRLTSDEWARRSEPET